MTAIAVALALHIFGAVVWIGGIFMLYMCVRPALVTLEPPQRFTLMRATFQRAFPWIWLSIVLLLGSGYWMLKAVYGGFASAPLYVNLMMGLGWVMIALFVWMFSKPWPAFKRAVEAQDWTSAGANLGRIRRVMSINLLLGILVVIIGGTGRYWG